MGWGEPHTAFDALEREHYQVARAAIDLAREVRNHLFSHPSPDLKRALDGFEKAAARVV